MIDFKELPQDGKAFEQFIRELLLIYDLHPHWTGQGADQGRDILATEHLSGAIGEAERVWLVQCKHFAHANRSVGRDDVGSVIDDCRQVGANGYLLVCSTHPSSGLVTKLKEISNRPENGLVTVIWDAVDLEKKLQEPRFFGLGHLFFPKSFASTPWKLYNRGAPNHWTAHYGSYFIHLGNRIAGSHPRLEDCELIVKKLEAISPLGEDEHIRPRAIWFDDKNGNYHVFADYLVPYKKVPTLKPSGLSRILVDYAIELASGMSYVIYWDLQLKRIDLGGDHFSLDHYDFYNPWDGNFQAGIPRGPTFDELCLRGDSWSQ